MGLDPVTGIGTGCWPGMRRLADYLFERFGGGNLGCFNPASRAGGGPSLHAEGRAQDFAFNANNSDERAAGDALFRWAVEHADEIGLQEMLWRGAIWYFPRRGEFPVGWGDFADLPGVYGPVQQGDHMSHVHLGVDKNAGMNWQPDWITEDDMAEADLTLKALNDVRDVVGGEHNLDGSAPTIAQVVRDLIRVEKKVDSLTAAPPGSVALLPSDLDAIAEKVADKLAVRLKD